MPLGPAALLPTVQRGLSLANDLLALRIAGHLDANDRTLAILALSGSWCVTLRSTVYGCPCMTVERWT